MLNCEEALRWLMFHVWSWQRRRRNSTSDMHCWGLFALILWSVGIESRKLRGVSLSYKRFYRESKAFLCIDGSKMIPFEQVNDDYCDCDDGSDEPGTSACPDGRFYCANLGFRPRYIPSSRVNDGICDCCDASDEYNSPARCQNSCRSLVRKERAEVEGHARTLDEGLRLKQQRIEEGVSVWREKQAQLRELQRLSEDLQTELEERRRRRRRRRGEAEQLAPRGKRPQENNGVRTLSRTATGASHQPDGDDVSSIAADEVQAELAPAQDEERGASEDEATALLRGNQLAGLATFQKTFWRSLRAGDRLKIKGAREGPASRTDEDPDIKAAASAADEEEEERADLRKIEEAWENVHLEIRELTAKLSIDYGTEKEFLFLGGLCLQLKVYEKWGTWAGSPENQYCRMRYESGELCWQGPTRNTMVTLTCGTETALRSVREPSKCQYVMDLQTPVACHPALRPRGVHSEL